MVQSIFEKLPMTTDTLADTLGLIERRAAHNESPQSIVRVIRERNFETDFDRVAEPLGHRIAELSEAAKTRPDHTKLTRGIEIMREVARLLEPREAEAELTELAERIRVCVAKSDNYAATAGKHLRQARDRCREIGLDFNKWCAQTDLGIKRSRIYALMGPDPIAAERRDEKHSEEPENVHSLDIAQFPNGEWPSSEDAPDDAADVAESPTETQQPADEPDDGTVTMRISREPQGAATAIIRHWDRDDIRALVAALQKFLDTPVLQ
jgi:hypothetical protein